MVVMDRYTEVIAFTRHELELLLGACENWFYATVVPPNQGHRAMTALEALSMRPMLKLVGKLEKKYIKASERPKPVKVTLEPEEIIILLTHILPTVSDCILLTALGKIDQKSLNFQQYVDIAGKGG
jgi:hypothetical protein